MWRDTLKKLAAAIELPVPDNRHRTGPKKYSMQSLAKLLLFRNLLGMKSDREMERKLGNWKELREACGLKDTPCHSTISRARDRINLADIFNCLVRKAKQLGLVKGFIISVDSTQFEAYLKKDKEARLGYCAAKDKFIFGYKAHIITDANSELPIAVVVSPANEHDSKHLKPLLKRVFRNFMCNVKKLLGDSAYDSSAIRKFLRKIGIEDVIDRNKRRSREFPKIKDEDYKKRSASERVNSYAKGSFGLEGFTFAGIRRALQHTYACLAAMLYSAIASFEMKNKNWRRVLI
jgi:IS5 family transposase